MFTILFYIFFQNFPYFLLLAEGLLLFFFILSPSSQPRRSKAILRKNIFTVIVVSQNQRFVPTHRCHLAVGLNFRLTDFHSTNPLFSNNSVTRFNYTCYTPCPKSYLPLSSQRFLYQVQLLNIKLAR